MCFPNWSHVKTFEDLVETNALFVRGDLESAPYHASPLMPDSVPLIPNLLRLHARGIVTTNGQSSKCTYGKHVSHTWESEGNSCGNWYYDQEQKPYVDFIMLKAPLSNTRFIDLLMQNDKFVAKVTDFELQKLWSNFSPRGGQHIYNLTRDRSNNLLEELPNTAWRNCTNLHLNDLDSLEWTWPYHIADMLRTSVISVEVAMKQYGRGDLERELLQLCDIAGVAESYQFS